MTDGNGGNVVGGGAGTTPGGPCTGACNLISVNTAHGVQLSAPSPSTVEGNFIGTDVTGLAALGNGNYGIPVFGGTGHSIRNNVVSANFVGIGMNAAPGVVIQGNFVGTDAAGTAALPNEYAGIGSFNGSDGTQIGGRRSRNTVRLSLQSHLGQRRVRDHARDGREQYWPGA